MLFYQKFAVSTLGLVPTAWLMVEDMMVDTHRQTCRCADVGGIVRVWQGKKLLRAGADLILPGTADLMNVLLDP